MLFQSALEKKNKGPIWKSTENLQTCSNKQSLRSGKAF